MGRHKARKRKLSQLPIITETERMMKSCFEKVAYVTEEEAQEVADIHHLGVYKCQYCKNWHLTSLN